MKVSIFGVFGLKMLLKAPKVGVLGNLIPKLAAISTKLQKSTSLLKSTLFKPSSAKICQPVSPVGEFPKKGINT